MIASSVSLKQKSIQIDKGTNLLSEFAFCAKSNLAPYISDSSCSLGFDPQLSENLT